MRGPSPAGSTVTAAEPEVRRARAGRAFALATTLLTALSCQAVFGDYRIDTSEVVDPIEEACEPGEARCSGATLQTCAPDGQSFEAGVTCASAALCNVETEGCTRCTPGQHQCNGAELRRCTSNASWEEVETCDSPRLCSVSADKLSGSCLETCLPGTVRCTGTNLERCAEEGERWDLVDTCQTSKLCELAQASAVSGEPLHCAPQLCRAGEFTCDDAGSVRACDATLTSWGAPASACTPKELCNPKLGACKACTPGEHACSGTALLACNAAGQWETLDECASVAQCDPVKGTCTVPACTTPGVYRCESPDNLLQLCRSDLTAWETRALCKSFDLCNADEGRCEPAACASGATRCQGPRLESCVPGLTGWKLDDTCKTGEVCDPAAGCVPGPCAANTTRCNDRFLERCSDGQWQRLEKCASRELCEKGNGACLTPACEAGTYKCDGAKLSRCPFDESGFVVLYDCTPPTRCDEAAGACL